MEKDHKANEFQSPLLEPYRILAYYFANCMELCKIARQEALSSDDKLTVEFLLRHYLFVEEAL
jgi:hypothetical protein